MMLRLAFGAFALLVAAAMIPAVADDEDPVGATFHATTRPSAGRLENWAGPDESSRLLRAILRMRRDEVNQIVAENPGQIDVHSAAAIGLHQRMAALIEQQPDRRDLLVNGMTPLAVAAMKGQLVAMRHLMDLGANIDAGAATWTPLFVALRARQVEAVRLLLRSDATLPAVAEDIDDLLLLVAQQPNAHEVFAAIAERGAIASASDAGRRRALSQAATLGHETAVVYLIDLAGIVDPIALARALTAAASDGQTPVVCRLLERGASVDPVHEVRAAPLHAAAWSGHLQVIALLLDRGADPNALDDQGRTPLDMTTFRKDKAAALLLESSGARRSSR